MNFQNYGYSSLDGPLSREVNCHCFNAYSSSILGLRLHLFRLNFCLGIEMALLSIKNDIHLSLSRGAATALVLLDLSAAFDTIDHSTLVGCLLDWFGVGGSALKWFFSYLTERYQSVKIGSTLSNLQKTAVRHTSGFCFGSSAILSVHISP